MAELLNYKDSKNIIIYLLTALILAGGTLYAKDQGRIEKDQKAITDTAKSDKTEIIDFIKSTSESQKRRDDKYRYFFRDEMAKFHKVQAGNTDKINKMSIDLAILKAMKNKDR